MRVIILGAGGTGSQLLRRLGDMWEAVVIDSDRSRLDAIVGLRPFEAVHGDGSSAVVLERAGLGGAAALVAATSDDDVNLEAIRIARAAGVLRVAGVAAQPGRMDEYRSLDVPVFSPHGLAARQVELVLEPRRVASSAFAGGKAEAIEVQLASDSPVVGRRLRDVHSSTWVVAAVLRGGDVIIPHGDTVLEAGDRVTVVGSAAHYKLIVESFTTGVSSFPLAYGRKVAVAVTSEDDLNGPFIEAVNLVRNSHADALTIVHRSGAAGDSSEGGMSPDDLLERAGRRAEGVDVEVREASSGIDEALAAIAGEESVGVVVVPGPEPGGIRCRFRVARLVNEISQARVPMLLARSTEPYESIVVPARRTAAGDNALRAAIDLAAGSALPLHGVAAAGPNFVATRVDTMDAARAAVQWFREEAASRAVEVETTIEQGNPVRVIAARAGAASLLVIGTPPYPVRPLALGVSGLVAARVAASVLFVPPPR